MSVAIEIDGQYRTLREEAGAAARPRGFVVVGGQDAAEYLQGQLTNDIEALEPGHGSYSALLDRKGKMQADMRVLRTADDVRMSVEPHALDAVLRHLTMYAIGRDVTVEDHTSDFALISVVGPAAPELTGLPPLGAENDHAEAQLDGVDITVIRTDQGLDLVVPLEDRDRALGALAARGVAGVTEDALEIVRVETGRPRYGREMTTETIPQEAGINERAVSFTKGCYIGQETVARLHYKGKPNRHLRGLELSSLPDAGALVTLGDRELGRIGTAVLSPAFGPIALAILRREAEPGADVTVEGGIDAKVVDLPFRDE
ncbi:MAG TPA: folate-binding protein [Solirubrobacterales bacterium]|nr:folate-binding protein [Solirubrobacterales bacterium]